MTKEQIIEQLKEKGIEFNSRDSKAKLEALLPVEDEAIVEEIIEKEEVEKDLINEITEEEITQPLFEHYDETDDMEEEAYLEKAVEEFSEEEVEAIESEVEEEFKEMNADHFWELYETAEKMIEYLVEESNNIPNLKPLSRRLKPVSRTLGKFKRFKQD